MMTLISNMIMPLILLSVLIYAISKKTNVYSAFVEGAKESFEMIFDLFPTFLAMTLAINIIVNSNFIYNMLSIIKPIFDTIKIPYQVVLLWRF